MLKYLRRLGKKSSKNEDSKREKIPSYRELWGRFKVIVRDEKSPRPTTRKRVHSDPVELRHTLMDELKTKLRKRSTSL